MFSSCEELVEFVEEVVVVGAVGGFDLKADGQLLDAV